MVSKTTTNEVGFYLVPGVLPGPYLLVIEASGMERFEGNLTVSVQQSAVVDVAMKVGQTATEVQVHDVTPILNVDNPTLGDTLERTRIEQLPLNGRAVTSLLQTIPGMEGAQGTRAFGLRDFSVEMSLDGAALVSRYGPTISSPNYVVITYAQPGLDSIQEFKVETNSSSAKFTRPTNIVVTTKGGTNDLHGSAFETNRNNAVGLARSRTDYYTSPPYLNRNEFGASAGGPVYLPKVYNGKNRTFWFFSYEALRQLQSTTMSYPVPTQAWRNGDMSSDYQDNTGTLQVIYNPWTTDPNTWQRQQFSYNGRLNVIDPALLNPMAKLLMSVTALPTLPNVNPNLAANWYGPEPTIARTWTTSARVDQRFGDKDNFYGRYTQGGYRTREPFYTQPTLNFNVAAAGTDGYIAPNKSVALSWVHTFSPTFFNELLVSGARGGMFDGTGAGNFNYDAELGLPNPFHSNGWPAMYSLGMGNVGAEGYGFETQNTAAYYSFYGILDDNLTRIHGKHEFQFGFHYRYDQIDLEPQQQYVAGECIFSTLATALYDPSTSRTNPAALGYTGENFANFWLGVPNYSAQFTRAMYYARAREYATYFQDNWRVTPRLTLNLGLRWDYWPAFTEKNQAVVGFDPTNDAIVLGQPLSTLYALSDALPSIVSRVGSFGGQFESWQQAGLPNGNLMSSTHKDFGPRLGFAYRVGEGRKSFVVRGGYRISYFHIPLSYWAAAMRSNTPMYARFQASETSASYTPDGIANYSLRAAPYLPLAGTSTTVLDQAVSTGLGLVPGCCGVYYFAKDQPDPRVEDWNFTMEKDITSNMVVRASYIGNHTSHLEQNYQYNNTTPTYIWYLTTGLPLPTGTLSGVATRPFDQKVWGTLEQWQNTGWGNSNGISLEMQRRYSKGYGWQVFYVMDNNFAAGGQGYNGTSIIPALNQYLPGQVPADQQQLDHLVDYQRDTSVPKYRVRWNWIVDLPFGKGKPIAGNAGGVLDRLVGGWQVTGLGSLQSNYFSLPSGLFPTSDPVQIYGYKYPIQNCTSGTCYPGYLWWNGYIPAYLINSHNAVTGLPNGYEGIPANYHPAVQPLWPWPSTIPPSSDPLKAFYGTNTVWVPISNGTVQRTTYTGLPPLLNQYLPSIRTWSMDASLIKNIPIKERFRFRLSADFFNVLNCPGNPNSIASTGILSTQNSGNPPRTIQLSGRLTW